MMTLKMKLLMMKRHKTMQTDITRPLNMLNSCSSPLATFCREDFHSSSEIKDIYMLNAVHYQ